MPPPNPKRSLNQGEDDVHNQISSTGVRRVVKRTEEAIPTSVFDTENLDRELQAQYGMTDTEYKPAFLYVERGPGQGQLLEVKQGTVVIGRASVSDLRVQHPSISRRHAQVKRVGEQFFVKDLGSQNGTFVNKSRIATEVEVKIGDTLTLGNAQLKLRGPMTKSEQAAKPKTSSVAGPSQATLQPAKSRQSTAVVARPSQGQVAPAPQGSSRALKIAVFAGAMGFGLAAVLAFAMVKMVISKDTDTAAPKKLAAATPAPSDLDAERERLIQEAIAARMAAQKAAAPAPVAAAPANDTVVEAEEPKIQEGQPANVKAAPAAAAPAAVAPAAAHPPSVKVAAAAPAPKRTAAAPLADEFGEEPVAKGKGGNRQSILAEYERGNAEGSLAAAKKAGDKELSQKLADFIAFYDAARDAMAANNGSGAITNFTKAKNLDDQLSSGWSKYGTDIRRQLASIYVLLGMQYDANGNAANAKKSYEAALKFDPSNEKAKAKLAAASGGDEGGEEAPIAVPKAAPKKAAPAKSSIDDAFGD